MQVTGFRSAKNRSAASKNESPTTDWCEIMLEHAADLGLFH